MDDAAFITPVRLDAETPADAASVEALVLHAFGPGRFARTAERLREGATVAAGFVGRDAGKVVGSVRLWSITIGGRSALFLGPIAVSSDCRKAGLGAELVAACVQFAERSGQGVLLVGDVPYFSRFGFVGAPDVRLPGPVDQRRVLWLGAGEVEGPVRIA